MEGKEEGGREGGKGEEKKRRIAEKITKRKGKGQECGVKWMVNGKKTKGE